MANEHNTILYDRIVLYDLSREGLRKILNLNETN